MEIPNSDARPPVALLSLAAAACVACGPRENVHANLHPGEPFEAFREDFAREGSCATDGNATTGCGTVAIAGAAAGGGFTSSDFRVTCGVKGNAYVVRISDAVDPEDAGVEIVASFRGLQAPPPRARICKGVERDDVPPQVRLKATYCTVQARVQNHVYTSTANAQCTVRVTGASPFRGTVSCAALYDGDDALTVEDETVFTCPVAP